MLAVQNRDSGATVRATIRQLYAAKSVQFTSCLDWTQTANRKPSLACSHRWLPAERYWSHDSLLAVQNSDSEESYFEQPPGEPRLPHASVILLKGTEPLTS